MPDDPEQLRMDLEDANARLESLRRTIEERDQAEANVRRLQIELANAKRRLKEAGWKVSLLLSRERRKS